MKKVLLLSLFLLLAIAPGPIASEEQNDRELFSRAYSHYSKGDLISAQNLFLKTLGRDFALEDYSLYFLSKISFSRGDLQSAHHYKSQLKLKFPNSVWIPKVNLQLAKIYLEEKKYNQAIVLLVRLNTKDSKSSISPEVLYVLGLVYEKQERITQAYEIYLQLRQRFPLTPWDDKAKRKVQKLRAIYPDLFSLENLIAHLEEIDLLLKERDFTGAEKTLLNLPDLSAKPNLLLRKLRTLARVYQQTRMRLKESKVLNKIIKRFPDEADAAKTLNRLARIYWNKGENLKALSTFGRLKKNFPKSSHVDFAELASARILESLRKPDEAIRIYMNFPNQFSRSPLRFQATWRLAWKHYLQANYQQAQTVFKKLSAEIGPKKYTMGARFWHARTAERMGDMEEAKKLYRKLLKSKHANYYAILATKRLNKLGETIHKYVPPGEQTPPVVIPSLSANIFFHFSRAQQLTSISLHHLAVVELDRIKDQAPLTSILRLALVREYARNHAFDRSIRLASRLNHHTQNLKQYLFPLAYWKIIKENSNKRGLDPYLILALMRQESLFDSDALSPASAFGLMQLLHSTAGQEAKKIGLPTPTPKNLFNPNLNIKLGTQHFHGLLKLYSMSIVKAIAAYNAGKTAVDRWEKTIQVHDEEEFIERIPYPETRNYVKLVLRNYHIYKILYDR